MASPSSLTVDDFPEWRIPPKRAESAFKDPPIFKLFGGEERTPEINEKLKLTRSKDWKLKRSSRKLGGKSTIVDRRFLKEPNEREAHVLGLLSQGVPVLPADVIQMTNLEGHQVRYLLDRLRRKKLIRSEKEDPKNWRSPVWYWKM